MIIVYVHGMVKYMYLPSAKVINYEQISRYMNFRTYDPIEIIRDCCI